jgi:hypothetical protein
MLKNGALFEGAIHNGDGMNLPLNTFRTARYTVSSSYPSLPMCPTLINYLVFIEISALLMELWRFWKQILAAKP